MGIESENVGIDIEGKNVGIDIEGENFAFDIEGENVEPSEHYVSPNYMRNEDPTVEDRQIPNSRPSRTPKWLLETDENIMDNLEGKRSTRTIRL